MSRKTILKKKSFTCIWVRMISETGGLFRSKNPDQIWNGLRLIIREKQSGIDANKHDDEIVALVDKRLESKNPKNLPQHGTKKLNFNIT